MTYPDYDQPLCFNGYAFPFSLSDANDAELRSLISQKSVGMDGLRDLMRVRDTRKRSDEMRVLAVQASVVKSAEAALHAAGITWAEYTRAKKFLSYALGAGSVEAYHLNARVGVFDLMLQHFGESIARAGKKGLYIAIMRRSGAPMTNRKHPRKATSTEGAPPIAQIVTQHEAAGRALNTSQIVRFIDEVIQPYYNEVDAELVAFSKRPLELVCPECGRTFEATRIGQTYHAPVCEHKAGERRRYQARKNLTLK